MTSLLINDIDDALHDRLRQSAEAHCRTIEEEALELLRGAAARQAAMSSRENIVDAARRLFGPENGVDLDIPPRGNVRGRPPPDFSDF